MNQSLSLITNKNNEQINKILRNFEKYLSTVNTGIISPRLLDNIYIKYDSKTIKIANIANIIVKKNIITIKPWDKKYIKFIENAILEHQSKFFPNNKGEYITIIIPPLTKEDRIGILKALKKQGEEIKIAMRQARRNSNNLIKTYIKKK